MPSARVLSVNVGSAVPSDATSAPTGTTGIDKRPVDRLVVRDPGPKHGGAGSGVLGDHIGDQRHHGGRTQAVYLFAEEELDHWGTELGRQVAPGGFGENVTTTGIAIDDLELGTVLGFGPPGGDGAVLTVCGPRIPCRTFAAHMGIAGWVKRFTQHGRTGVYCAVDRPGQIGQGDAITVLSAPGHGVDVVCAFRAFTGDLAAATRVLEAGALDPEHHVELAEVVARRTRRPASAR